MDKVSIIIPVYNAEKTISRCLDSIVSSSYNNYEIIIVNDGSTDSSASIISKYERSDQRIHVITQCNSGPSTARNVGMNFAQGEIIAFIDSDDYVRHDYIEQLAKTFSEQDVDVVFFEFQRVTAEGSFLSKHELPAMRIDYYDNIIALSRSDMFGYTWIKAFKKRLSEKIRFDEDVKLFEDEIFTCKLLAKPVKLYFLDEKIYYYVSTEGSIARSPHQNYCQLCDRVYNEWDRLLQKANNRDNYLQDKAEHFSRICKYYFLEQKVNKWKFYNDLKECVFMKKSIASDAFIEAVKNNMWPIVFLIYIKYTLKNYIARAVQRR